MTRAKARECRERRPRGRESSARSTAASAMRLHGGDRGMVVGKISGARSPTTMSVRRSAHMIALSRCRPPGQRGGAIETRDCLSRSRSLENDEERLLHETFLSTTTTSIPCLTLELESSLPSGSEGNPFVRITVYCPPGRTYYSLVRNVPPLTYTTRECLRHSSTDYVLCTVHACTH